MTLYFILVGETELTSVCGTNVALLRHDFTLTTPLQ